jgi:glycopeptide antibiotics resistance protein
MRILGADLPASGWTVVALTVGGLGSVLVWRTPRRRKLCPRRRRGATLCALLSATVVIALTLTPKGTHPTPGFAACIPYDWNDFVHDVFHTGGGASADVLNFCLMFPLTLSLVLATRRVLPVVALGLLLPPGIELLQTQLPGRTCAVSDMVTNSVGAVVGAAVGWTIELRSRRVRPPDSRPAHTSG